MNKKQLQELFAQLRGEARSLNEEGKIEEATAKINEMRDVKAKIDNIMALEEIEVEEARGGSRTKKNVVNEYRAVVKSIMGKELTEEERATIKSVDNGAVLPKEFVNEVMEIQKGYGSLKSLCDIIPVTTNEGTIPVVDLDQNEMAEVAEGQDIVDGTFVTTEIPFKCAKVGLIQSLSSELIEDAEIEIEGLIKKNFNNIAVAKENFKILKVVKDNATEITADSYESVQLAIDKSLPSVKSGLVTLTNITTYAHIKNMKDKNGKSLDLITTVNGVEMFHGKPIYAVEDTLLPVITEDKNYICYIVNMEEAVKYCERKGITIARSSEAGFKDDTIKLRILERFIPVKGSGRSIKKLEF